MMRDSLQERLKQKEENKPSENYHTRNVLEFLTDWLYFTRRAVNGPVAEYTREQRLKDDLDRLRPALQYAELCRMSAIMYRQPASLTRFSRFTRD